VQHILASTQVRSSSSSSRWSIGYIIVQARPEAAAAAAAAAADALSGTLPVVQQYACRQLKGSMKLLQRGVHMHLARSVACLTLFFMHTICCY
jgi:hypothetical protein